MAEKTLLLLKVSPDPYKNKIMRAADFWKEGEGAFVREIATITWKEGEVVTKERIKRAAKKLKEAYESKGYDCFEITSVDLIKII